MREGIWEDIEHDPTYVKQREYARRVIGLLVNTIRYPDHLFSNINKNMTPKQIADRVAKEAEMIGLVWFDDLHHAPMCPANNWSRQILPTGPCTCGAERDAV